jgi:AcrR family transcriptional regulator
MTECKYYFDVMSTAYEDVGRVRQKRRTRDALIAAARHLVAEGDTPTVEAAAEQADVSRTTAYRYFPSQAALLAAAHPEIVTTTMLPETAPADVAERLEIVVSRVTDLVVDTEAQQRTMLRLSLEPRVGRDELLLRQGRVIPWLHDALAPLADGLGDDTVRQLAIAIRSAIGIESFVWLTDVAGLTTADAVATMRWAARSMLDAARAGSLPPRCASATVRRRAPASPHAERPDHSADRDRSTARRMQSVSLSEPAQAPTRGVRA